MVCIHCGSKTNIYNSRHQRRNNQVWRRRRCISCGAIFTTTEQSDLSSNWLVLNKSEDITPFSSDKLMVSIYKSCRHRDRALEEARSLTDTIVQKLASKIRNGQINVKDISRFTQVALNRFDKAASTYYSVRHQ